MSAPATPEGYRLVTLIQRDPPAEVLRHAERLPGRTGRYARVVRLRHDLSKTIYEVLYFKAGRPPTREEVLAGLRGDLAALDSQAAQAPASRVTSWLDRKLFGGLSADEVSRKRQELLETLQTVEQNYQPGEAIAVP